MTCQEKTHLESLIREDFERCHPGETLEDLKRRASFSKEDRGPHARPRHPPPHPTNASAVSTNRSSAAVPSQPGEVPVWSSCDTAVANCAGAKGFSIRTLPSTPCDFQSGALALVM
jgi:hypothetical protein